MSTTYAQKQAPTQKKDAPSAVSVHDTSSQSESLQRKADIANRANTIKPIQRRTIEGSIQVDERNAILIKGDSAPKVPLISNMTFRKNFSGNYKKLIRPSSIPQNSKRGHLMKAAWDGNNDDIRINQWSDISENKWTNIEEKVQKKAKTLGKGIYKLTTETNDIDLWSNIKKGNEKIITYYGSTDEKNIKALNQQVSKASIFITNKKNAKELVDTIQCPESIKLELNV